MVETLVIVAVAAIIGAGLNTLRGYLHSKEPYSAKKLAGSNYVIVEGLIPQNYSIIGNTISKIDFRHQFQGFVLAIRKQNQLLREKVAHIKLKFSETLLIMTPRNRLDNLRNSNEMVILEEFDLHLRYERYWWISVIVIPAIMLLSSFEVTLIILHLFL